MVLVVERRVLLGFSRFLLVDAAGTGEDDDDEVMVKAFELRGEGGGLLGASFFLLVDAAGTGEGDDEEVMVIAFDSRLYDCFGVDSVDGTCCFRLWTLCP